jgi:hypothetical protein
MLSGDRNVHAQLVMAIVTVLLFSIRLMYQVLAEGGHLPQIRLNKMLINEIINTAISYPKDKPRLATFYSEKAHKQNINTLTTGKL